MTKSVSREDVLEMKNNIDNPMIKWACDISIRVKDLEKEVERLKGK